jgi:hypothetical protein
MRQFMLCALLSHDKIPFSSHPIFGVNTAVGAADGERCLCRMARLIIEKTARFSPRNPGGFIELSGRSEMPGTQ